MIGYVYVYSNKTMSFKVIDKGLVKRYTKTWQRVNGLVGKELDSELVMVIMINT